MRRMAIIALALILLGSALSGEDLQWKSYESLTHGYSVDYPADWETATEDSTGIFTATFNDEENLPVSLALSVEELSEEDKAMNFDDYLQYTREAIESDLNNQGFSEYEVTRTGKTVLGGKEAYLIELDTSLMGLFTLRMKIIAARHIDKLYMIGLTADQELFEDYSALFGQILASYKFRVSR